MSGKRYTAQDDKIIIANYQKAGLPTLLKKLGRPATHTRGLVPHMYKLHQAGLIDWDERRQRRFTHWSTQDDLKLREMWGWHSADAIAKAMKRTKNSVQKRVYALDLPYVESVVLSATSTARLLKVETARVLNWIKSGILPAALGSPPSGQGINGSRWWNIQKVDLVKFIEQYPFFADFRVIDDKFWHEIAFEAAKGETYLSTGQFAYIQKVSEVLVGNWCRDGRLRCLVSPLPKGQRYFIPSSMLKETRVVRKRKFHHVSARRVSTTQSSGNTDARIALLTSS